MNISCVIVFRPPVNETTTSGVSSSGIRFRLKCVHSLHVHTIFGILISNWAECTGYINDIMSSYIYRFTESHDGSIRK